ncbi:type II toxin-antitoxin system VapC family toxin [Billgrantia gudaonensis]|uniref:Predicted nucleic acid-binding protein, contains PIN domain n=1 Tax=Billgrantia gudaonensis TaxID=376427 RepID=A0A1G8R081_9GAMM|nr:PIN domain-containing protein [Halomonas gudaonensis]SDJ10386.1 Predicted nucleic acid-binding protein, contains PIN domain [Halomonas gudaonensis]
MLDLNVLLDVLQKREPHYRVSAAVLEQVIHGDEQGAISAHAVTTVHYLVARYADRIAADRALSWLLHHLTVCAVGRNELERARSLGWSDFEDAVVAAVAERAGCTCIVTRNVKDFAGSPVNAVTPQEFLLH